MLLCAIVILLALLVALIAYWFWHSIYCPSVRALNHEITHYNEMDRLSRLESNYWMYKQWPETYIGSVAEPPSYDKRATPLIHDVPQLWSFSHRQQLQLYPDFTARYPSQRFWIYIGGTASNKSSTIKGQPGFSSVWQWLENNALGRLSAANANVTGSCVDPADMCDAYNAAYNTIIEKSHVESIKSGFLRFVDCDKSPLFCDIWGLNPVMLMYVETGPCRMIFPKVRWICNVKWHYVALPLEKMPWTRMQRIEGNLVPVFPSAEEQLSVLMKNSGALDALDLHTFEIEVDRHRERDEALDDEMYKDEYADEDEDEDKDPQDRFDDMLWDILGQMFWPTHGKLEV
ncbi:hypothetical protein H2203_000416 [Taxawa tesnikishii (nom. ined.)]|nr:hypothetical protein H2203_000416 [Dothideales sp. JES 119]